MTQPALFPAAEDLPPAWCFVCHRHRTQPRPGGCGAECLTEEAQ